MRTSEPLVLGVDLAKPGSDKTGIVVRRGAEVVGMLTSGHMMVLIHRACNGIYSFYDGDLLPGTVMQSKKALYPDGRRPDVGDATWPCQCCGERITRFTQLEAQPLNADALNGRRCGNASVIFT